MIGCYFGRSVNKDVDELFDYIMNTANKVMPFRNQSVCRANYDRTMGTDNY